MDIKDIDAGTLCVLLMAEHPQGIALALCLVEPRQAAEVLSAMAEPLRVDVAVRMASIDRVPEAAFEELECSLGVLKARKGGTPRVGGMRKVAEILNLADRSVGESILKSIDEEDAGLAGSIRQCMFAFEDIAGLENKVLRTILKEASTEDLALALRAARGALKEKIFKNMSPRAARLLREEMHIRGPVRVSEVLRAQQNIAGVARKLEEEGSIVLDAR